MKLAAIHVLWKDSMSIDQQQRNLIPISSIFTAILTVYGLC